MTVIPIEEMKTRLDVARQDSDTSLFLHLLYFGEMLLKLTAAGLIAAVMEDRERHRYRQIYRLVRADGLGEWSAAIDDVLTGPASQFLTPAARLEQRELTQACKKGVWQHDCVSLLYRCLCEIDPGHELVPIKIDGRRWFSLFAELRNKTRGHGAQSGTTWSRICPSLEQSIILLADNHHLFRRPWVYLYRNLSRKYRVTRLTDSSAPFDYLRSDGTPSLDNGVYVHFDSHSRVELVASDPEASDFYFPNGNFSGKKFELISYLSDNKQDGDGSLYLTPATELPPSHTQGIGLLQVQGQSFGNLPILPTKYIRRQELETELYKRLADDRHPVITARGAGGIGKTSLALHVLHRIAMEGKYGAIIWFSARDIDLLNQGPKDVKPQVLTEDEIAREFVQLMQPGSATTTGFRPAKYLAECLNKSPLDDPILFVFDNFETVRSPSSLYAWIDEYIRPPNKVLITTRFSDFKGDYPVEVSGMSETEAQELINETAFGLNIHRLLTPEYRTELYRESYGHPYVIKILLGEVAKAGHIQKIERIISGRTDIVEALFERTFAGLSPPAKHVFMTLSSWRSAIPQVAVEAVMLRPQNEKFDVDSAIEELRRSSFIEVGTSADGNVFLSVPLVAAIFGKRKLSVSPEKSSVEANTEILRFLGASQLSDLRQGIEPRVRAMFTQIAARVSKEKQKLQEYLPIMEFIASKFSPAWLLLARIYEESGEDVRFAKAKDSIRHYLEQTPKTEAQRPAWKRLTDYCSRTEDSVGEMQALVEMCELPDTPFNELSNAANRINGLFAFRQFLNMHERNILVRRLATLMESRITEGNATDCSRLAWLLMRLQDEDKARQMVKRGLELEPLNEHCQRLNDKLAQPLKNP